jgi:hypothetical protein
MYQLLSGKIRIMCYEDIPVSKTEEYSAPRFSQQELNSYMKLEKEAATARAEQRSKKQIEEIQQSLAELVEADPATPLSTIREKLSETLTQSRLGQKQFDLILKQSEKKSSDSLAAVAKELETERAVHAAFRVRQALVSEVTLHTLGSSEGVGLAA